MGQTTQEVIVFYLLKISTNRFCVCRLRASLNNAQFQAKENIAKVARDESSDITCSGIPSGQNQLTTEVFLHRSNK
jgi:hypothetical protein